MPRSNVKEIERQTWWNLWGGATHPALLSSRFGLVFLRKRVLRESLTGSGWESVGLSGAHQGRCWAHSGLWGTEGRASQKRVDGTGWLTGQEAAWSDAHFQVWVRRMSSSFNRGELTCKVSDVQSGTWRLRSWQTSTWSPAGGWSLRGNCGNFSEPGRSWQIISASSLSCYRWRNMWHVKGRDHYQAVLLS